jgi:hypothetical protein
VAYARSALRVPDAADEVVEAGVGAQRIEAGLALHVDHQRVALAVALLQPGDGLVGIAGEGVEGRDDIESEGLL